MIQQIGRFPVRVLGRTVTDGGMLWMLSSLSEAGFRIAGARRLEMVLQFLKSYFIIFCITTAEIAVGLFVIRVPRPLLRLRISPCSGR